MKLILVAPVERLGAPGDVVEVKDGYGRNYLLPKGLAIAYNRGTAKQIEGIQRARAARSIRDNEHAQEVRSQLEELQIELAASADDQGKLYGSVTPKTLAQSIKKAGGPDLDKRSLSVAKPIKSTGKHVVTVKLTDAVSAHVSVNIVSA